MRRAPFSVLHPISRCAPLAVLALAALSACQSSGLSLRETATTRTIANDFSWEPLTLGPGDVLRVGVWGHPELSAPPHPNVASGARIDGEGNVSLPLIGAVHVEGLHVSGASSAITAAFSRYLQDPKIDVSVAEYAARRFYLLGEVQKPGAIVLDRPLTLYQGLALAGGTTPRANRAHVVLVRGAPSAIEVHVFDADQPALSGFAALRPDDLVFVRRNGAGKFSDEVLPYLTGVASSLSSVATLLLIDDQLDGN